MKKALKIIGIILIVTVILFFNASYIVEKNEETKEKLTSQLQKKYQASNINYTNQYNNYYIIKTDSNIVVLDKEYKEVLKEELSKIKEKKLNIIYKTNKLMYEKPIVKKDKLIYQYYDIYTGELLNTTELERK